MYKTLQIAFMVLFYYACVR